MHFLSTYIYEISNRFRNIFLQLLVSEGSLLVGQNSTAIKKSKYFYKACMDTKSVEERGIKPMLQVGSLTGINLYNVYS